MSVSNSIFRKKNDIDREFKKLSLDSNGCASLAQITEICTRLLPSTIRPERVARTIAKFNVGKKGTFTLESFQSIYLELTDASSSTPKFADALGMFQNNEFGRGEKVTVESVSAALQKTRVSSGSSTPPSSALSRSQRLSFSHDNSSSKSIQSVSGATEMSKHSLDTDELLHFIHHINEALSSDSLLAKRFPLKPGNFFSELADGLVLAKLINHAVPDTIDERALNAPTASGGVPFSAFKQRENLSIVISSAKAIGCQIINLGASDIESGKQHLILGLVWQLVRADLLSRINLRSHPELIRLFEEETGESAEQLAAQHSEDILLKWINHHLRKSKQPNLSPVTNFSTDLMDCRALLVLLNQLGQGSAIDLRLLDSSFSAGQRADQVLRDAELLGCRAFVTKESLVAGNPRLNLAFLANLFNKQSGLAPLSKAEQEKMLEAEGEDADQDRESKTFSFWINNLGITPTIRSFFEDLRDGVILLRVIGVISPGIIDEKLVTPPPVSSRFKKIENCNYVVDLCKKLGLVVSSIQGSNIVEGSKTYTLAIVWQLMREHILRTVYTEGKRLTENEVVDWANRCAGNAVSAIGSFRDPSLADSRFLLAILEHLRPGSINSELVQMEKSETAFRTNARYALTVARKLGATLFVMPDDITEVRSKMIFTFVASLMKLES